MSTLGHAREIARIDVVQMFRKYDLSKSGIGGLLSLLISVLLLLGVSVGGGYAAYRAGRAIAVGNLAEFTGTNGLATIGGVMAMFAFITAVVFLLRGLGARGTLDQPEGVLTVVPTIEAYLGTVLAEYVFYLLWVTGPAIGLGTGLALGLGIPWPAIMVPFAAAGLGVVSVGLGYPVGVGVRHLFTRFPFVARHKRSILVAVFAAYFVLIMTGMLNEVVALLFEPLQASPLAWFAHMALVGVDAFPASPLVAGASVAVTAAVAVLAVIGGTRIADLHWFSDPALAGEEEPTVATETPDRGVEQYLAPVVGHRTAALVTLAWRRASRSPLKLLYAMYPLFFLAGAFADIVQTGEVPAYLPYMMVLVVTWGAGVVFTLNPLGDQGAALSTTLLSKVNGKTFVHAHLFASLAIAIPVGVLVTGITAILSPVDTTTAAILVAASPLVMIVSATLSLGIGMAFPKFEATNVTRSMKTVLPSTMGFLLFSAHLLLTAVAAGVVYEPVIRELLAGFLSFLLPFGIAVTATQLYWISAVALVPLVLAPLPAYLYSIRRFDRYTIA